jgi:hypothetical protein
MTALNHPRFAAAALTLFTAAAHLLLATASPAADEPVSIKVGEFLFQAPDGWVKKAQPRAMSKGGLTFTPSGEGFEPVDADFYHFGAGQGGGVEANVQRWKGQFDTSEGAPQASEEKLESGGRSATVLHLKGTYLEGGPFQRNKTKRPGYALLGAILPSEAGAVFIKMTGPEKSVEAAKDAFKKLFGSAFQK